MTETFLATGGAAAPSPVAELRPKLPPTEAVLPYLRHIHTTRIYSN